MYVPLRLHKFQGMTSNLPVAYQICHSCLLLKDLLELTPCFS